jgi:hypothetical protein
VGSYYRAGLAWPGRRLDLLCHRHLPLLAVAVSSTDSSAALVFVEDVGLREALSETGPFRLLTVAELTAALSSADLSELGAAELKQIAYWQPDTVGQVLFNSWD